jgi:site-specific recombinase XerC
MTTSQLLDAAGRRRSRATMPGFHCGRPPRNKGRNYPADPPTVEDIVVVMRRAGDRTPGLRTRALVVLLWRAALRINEALSLMEGDLDAARGSILIRRGKGGRRRQVGIDAWGWEHLNRWLEVRVTMSVGALLCVLAGPTAGRPWSATAARATLRHLAMSAGVRRRFARISCPLIRSSGDLSPSTETRSRIPRGSTNLSLHCARVCGIRTAVTVIR